MKLFVVKIEIDYGGDIGIDEDRFYFLNLDAAKRFVRRQNHVEQDSWNEMDSNRNLQAIVFDNDGNKVTCKIYNEETMD